MLAGKTQAMALESLHRQTLADQLFGILQSCILNGELLPGTQISEEALAASYGVSRAPVREALAELERSGFAVRLGPRERIVVVPTAELIRQKYDLWWIVDAGRTYLASMDADRSDCAELRSLVGHMANAVASGDIPGYRGYSATFHSKIRCLCRNSAVNEIADRCDLYLRWFETIYDWMPEASMRSVNEHTEILDAFEAKDYASLTGNIRTHMLWQREHIVGLFEKACLAGQPALERPKPGPGSLSDIQRIQVR